MTLNLGRVRQVGENIRFEDSMNTFLGDENNANVEELCETLDVFLTTDQLNVPLRVDSQALLCSHRPMPCLA